MHVNKNSGSKTKGVRRSSTIRLVTGLLLAAGVGFITPRSEAALTTLVDFPNLTSPVGGLVQGKDGLLYGTTESGGANGTGMVYQVTLDGMATTIHSFTGGNGGASPDSSLVVAEDGSMYGTTIRGGNQKDGVIYRVTTNGDFNVVHSLAANVEGAFPIAGLIMAKDGRLFGTAASGGPGAYGTVFRASTSGNLVVLRAFNGPDGAEPYGKLVRTSDGNLYGTTTRGGAGGISNGLGTVFRLATNGTLTTLHSFAGTDGAYPYAGLTRARDGNLYGTTRGRLANGTGTGRGTIFRVSPSGAFTDLYTFTGGGDGQYPFATLLLASDGALYGTSAGSTNVNGAIFKITTAGAFTQLAQFNDSNGSEPFGELLQASDGNIYGTTSSGGANGGGTMFRFDLEAPPFILEPPRDVTVTNRTPVILTVKAGGSPTLAYRWLFKGMNLTNDGNISGADTSTLTINDAEQVNAGPYSVRVSNQFGAVNSETGTLRVIVMNPDVTISQPSKKTSTSNDVIEVTGKASGKLGVAGVFVRSNEGGWIAAETINSFVNWSVDVPLEAGTNILQAYAADADGRTSETNTVTVFRVVTAPIAVAINGTGSVKPNLDGMMLSLGQGYTMTAKPGKGFSFTGWTGGATNAKTKLSFIMEPDLSLTANFVDSSRPVLKVKSPKKKTKVSEETLAMAGTTKDNAGVAGVFYQLNLGAWTLADTTNSFTNWSATVTVLPGTNSVSTYAVDVNGLISTTNKASVLFE